METIQKLREFDAAATPAPWREFCESGDWWIGRADEDGGPADDTSVCDSNPDVWTTQMDTDLTTAMRNALGALLDVAEAAEAVVTGWPASEKYAALRDALARLAAVKL